MSSIDITMTGAAGAAPTPALAVCPSAGGSTVLGRGVRMAPVAAPDNGTGLAFAGTTAVRPWGLAAGAEHSAVATVGGFAPIAQRTTTSSTTSSTPGDLPPRDPLS